MPTDVKSSTYVDFGVERNDKDSKLKSNDHINIRTFLKKVRILTGQKCFLINKLKNTVPWPYVIGYLNSEKLFKRFTKKN